MDIKRLTTAIFISAVILIGFDYFVPQHPAHPPAQQTATQSLPAGSDHAIAPTPGADSQPVSEPVSEGDKRISVDGPDVEGSINLRGAQLDDLLLKRYHVTVKQDSPQVRVLEKRTDPQPNLVRIGWHGLADNAVRLPNTTTLWTADGDRLTPDHPVTLRWDNGAGLVFSIGLALDRHYMFTVTQSVANHGAQAVSLFPTATVERDYTPEDTGGFLAHEGPVSVMDGRLEEDSYKSLRNGSSPPNEQSWSRNGTGGWAGITDKYWLTAIAPDQGSAVAASYGYVASGGAGTYRVGFITQAPVQVAAGATASTVSHIFAGAKEVNTLEQYGASLHIPDFYKAIDFGWFGFLTRPMFHLLHWLYGQLGNFGLALLTFTLIIKLVMFPLATKTVKSGARMRALAPRVQAIRDRNKDNPVAANQQVMALYREEGVNMFGGCLPMVIQLPVFFCLYKVLNIAIEMRHAPFFGWIHDLSAGDPTNIFNLFGLLPFDPSHFSPYLHVGVWPILFGFTTYLMQRMNMATMDPAQQRIMQFMPIMYVLFMGRLPAGIVIYYTWNNLLTAGQQMLIQARIKKAMSEPQVLPPTKKPAKR